MPNKYAQYSKRTANLRETLFTPEVILDFHDKGPLTPFDIERQLEKFIEECMINKCTQILIITGKGLNSPKGPKVKPQVISLLKKTKTVQNFRIASAQNGGEGAIEAVLISNV